VVDFYWTLLPSTENSEKNTSVTVSLNRKEATGWATRVNGGKEERTRTIYYASILESSRGGWDGTYESCGQSRDGIRRMRGEAVCRRSRARGR
jgi:hypothetical protein